MSAPWTFEQARAAAHQASANQRAGEDFVKEAHKAYAISEKASPGWLNKTLGRWMVCVNGKQQYRARYVMEQHIGRPLARDEHVHHRNGDKLDDRIENLELIGASEHARLHLPDRQAARGARYGDQWSGRSDRCAGCSTSDRPHYALGLCRTCYAAQRVRRQYDHTCDRCGTNFRSQSKRQRYCSHTCSGRSAIEARWGTPVT